MSVMVALFINPNSWDSSVIERWACNRINLGLNPGHDRPIVCELPTSNPRGGAEPIMHIYTVVLGIGGVVFIMCWQ